ncbi:MAG TPA: DMT family transporter [Spirochaetes bacterium]|nr:DMT family transporter [Spirochaetota bacterium]
MESRLGELAALATAFFWTITALSFESAGRRVGSLAVNLIRLMMAFGIIAIYTGLSRGLPLPVDASAHAWLWLGISGLIGFVLGDLLLFRAFVLIGSRVAMLIYSLVPPLTALFGYLLLGETLVSRQFLGMGLVMGGIVLVVLDRRPGAGGAVRSPAGVIMAIGGAVCQAAGLITSKFGMGGYNPFASNHIRIAFGILGFCLVMTALGRWGRVFAAFRDRGAMARIGLGAFFGPFLGVGFALVSLQLTSAGAASTIMATVPVLIIPPSMILFKERPKAREILGALLAVAGVAVMFF